MNKALRIFWGLLLLSSVGWVIGGSFITSEAYEGGTVGSELTEEITSLAGNMDIQVPSELPLPVLFLATGLPLAAVSLYFYWRNHRMIAGSGREAPNLRRQTIGITFLALIVALLIWNIRGVNANSPTLSAIVYPVRLFVTFVHEAGHSLAALLTGGQVQGFTVSPDGSGLAVTAGGYRALVIPAGYLGAALFGSLLFFLANRIPEWTRALSILIGVSIIILTLSYAMPDQAGNTTALIVGIGFGVAILAMGWQAPRVVNVFILNTLAILTGLNAVFDLWFLVGNSGAGNGQVVNDAAAFANEYTPLLPASIVAFLWAAVAVFMSAVAIYFGLIKQVGGEIGEVVKGNTSA